MKRYVFLFMLLFTKAPIAQAQAAFTELLSLVQEFEKVFKKDQTRLPLENFVQRSLFVSEQNASTMLYHPSHKDFLMAAHPQFILRIAQSTAYFLQESSDDPNNEAKKHLAFFAYTRLISALNKLRHAVFIDKWTQEEKNDPFSSYKYLDQEQADTLLKNLSKWRFQLMTGLAVHYEFLAPQGIQEKKALSHGISNFEAARRYKEWSASRNSEDKNLIGPSTNYLLNGHILGFSEGLLKKNKQTKMAFDRELLVVSLVSTYSEYRSEFAKNIIPLFLYLFESSSEKWQESTLREFLIREIANQHTDTETRDLAKLILFRRNWQLFDTQIEIADLSQQVKPKAEDQELSTLLTTAEILRLFPIPEAEQSYNSHEDPKAFAIEQARRGGPTCEARLTLL